METTTVPHLTKSAFDLLLQFPHLNARCVPKPDELAADARPWRGTSRNDLYTNSSGGTTPTQRCSIARSTHWCAPASRS
jgi:hypothetical protein